ncbi:MAG: hypothetical protein ACOCV2_00130 [Persicimonas sp.]
MNDSKICVLGGANFLGREICRLAVATGRRVVSISAEGRPEQTAPWLEGVEWLTADPERPDAWREQVDGCEAFIDCHDVFEPVAPDAVERAKQAVLETSASRYVYISPDAADPPAASGAEESSAPKPLDEALLAAMPAQTVVLRPGPIDRHAAATWDEETTVAREAAATGGVERERVAIAALRAALEPDRSGVFDADEVAHLGDAMFIQ